MSDSNSAGSGQTHGPGDLPGATRVVGGLTLLSRLAGLARDISIGAVLGAGPVADAFFVAFRIPNLLRRLLAEGATSMAFVPVFTRSMVGGGPGAALATAGAVGAAFGLALLALTIVGVVMAGPIASALAPGFAADPERMELTGTLLRWMWPYLFLAGAAAWASGVLHTFGRFAAPALAPVVLNVAVIAAACFAAASSARPELVFAVGVLIGGTLQFAVQCPSLRAVGLRLAMLRPRREGPAVRRAGKLLAAATFGGAVHQFNVLLATVFASLLPAGSVSYLWYADRLFEFPAGIVAATVGVAVLPGLAARAQAADRPAMAEMVGRALALSAAFCLPAMMGLWLLADDIVELLFERGGFGAHESAMTAWALRASIPGLLAIGVLRVLTAAFHGMEKPRVPMAAALLSITIAAVLNLALMGPVDAEGGGRFVGFVATVGDALRIADLRHAGLALATALAACVQAAVLLLALRRLLPDLDLSVLAGSLLRHGAAAAAMGAVVLAWRWLGADWPGGTGTALRVGGGVGVGIVGYAVAAVVLGSEEVRGIIPGRRPTS